MPMNVLSLVANDTESIPLTFESAPGTPVDITGWTIKLHIGYATPLVLSATVTDGPGGIASVTVGAGQLVAGKWMAEIQCTKPSTKIQTSDLFIANIRAQVA